MPQPLDTDVLIAGGGIAGLWLQARLQRLGYRSLLVERDCLGGGQTGKSQGIIHGGIKYALHGALSGASEAIAAMPERWRRALAGEGELDLRGVRLLSPAHYLWAPATLGGRLTGFFASRALRGRVDPVTGAERPGPLQHPDCQGQVYRLAELVLDVPGLLAHLARQLEPALLAARDLHPVYQAGRLAGLQADGRTIHARCTVLCAGAGNAGLLAQLGLQQPAMQRRPLQMVMLQAPALQPLYVHCLGHGPKPRLTITSHPAPDGRLVWYLGGELAEAAGVDREPAAQIAAARQELQRLLPWLSLEQARWATLRVDRAEPAQAGLARPEQAFVSAPQNGLLVGWPTKLALAPDFADRAITALQQMKIRPGTGPAWPGLPRPPLARPFIQEVLNEQPA